MAEFIWTGEYRIALPEGADPVEVNTQIAVRLADVFDDLGILAVGSARVEEATDGEADVGATDQER